MNNKDGKMLFEKEEIEKRWVEYIKELYDDSKRKERATPTGEQGPPILLSEVKAAIGKMRSGKAPGIDEIPTECLAALDDNSLTILTQICNQIYSNGHIPKDLLQSVFIKIPKKAKAVECADHRTISLMSNIMKLILRIILDRNSAKINQEISEHQSGFLPNKGTREGISNLRTILERS